MRKENENVESEHVEPVIRMPCFHISVTIMFWPCLIQGSFARFQPVSALEQNFIPTIDIQPFSHLRAGTALGYIKGFPLGIEDLDCLGLFTSHQNRS